MRFEQHARPEPHHLPGPCRSGSAHPPPPSPAAPVGAGAALLGGRAAHMVATLALPLPTMLSMLWAALVPHLESVTKVSTSESSPKKPRYTTVRLAGRPSGRTVAICTYRLWRTPRLALRARLSTSRQGATVRSGVAAAGAAIAVIGYEAGTSLQGSGRKQGGPAAARRQVAAAAAAAAAAAVCMLRSPAAVAFVMRRSPCAPPQGQDGG